MRWRVLTKMFYLLYLAMESLPGPAQSPVKLKSTATGFLIVPVSINGSGPYEFILDTGSNCTLVRNSLMTKLGVPQGRESALNLINGRSFARTAHLDKIVVGNVGVASLEVFALNGSEIEVYAHSAEGVLGEDFLRNFDILIDNRNRELTLDSTAKLSSILTGEHIPLLLNGIAGNKLTKNRPIVEVRIYPGSAALRFLVDSGSNYGLLLVGSQMFRSGEPSSGTLRTLSGQSRCQFAFIRPKAGMQFLPRFQVAECEGSIRGRSDVDGFLPTNIFERLFLSHSNGYVLVNPVPYHPIR